MATIGERREAVLVVTIVVGYGAVRYGAVGYGAEAGPCRSRPMPPRSGARGHTLGVLQCELDTATSARYVAAVATHAADGGLAITDDERAAAEHALVSRQPQWVDVPARFRHAGAAFGEHAGGEAWIHDAIDAPAIAAGADAALRVIDAAAATGRPVVPRTRPEIVAMIARLALRAGAARVEQLVQALETGAFVGVSVSAGRRIACVPLKPGMPLSPDWIDAVVRRLDVDGARSWVAEGVAQARRQATLFSRVAATAAGADLLARLASMFEPVRLSPRAFREHAGLAALLRWSTTGRVVETEVAAARDAGEPPAPRAPVPRPVLRLAPRAAAARV